MRNLRKLAALNDLDDSNQLKKLDKTKYFRQNFKAWWLNRLGTLIVLDDFGWFWRTDNIDDELDDADGFGERHGWMDMIRGAFERVCRTERWLAFTTLMWKVLSQAWRVWWSERTWGLAGLGWFWRRWPEHFNEDLHITGDRSSHRPHELDEVNGLDSLTTLDVFVDFDDWNNSGMNSKNRVRTWRVWRTGPSVLMTLNCSHRVWRFLVSFKRVKCA